MQLNKCIDLDAVSQHAVERITHTYDDPEDTNESRMACLSNDIVIDLDSMHEENCLRFTMVRYWF